MVAYSYKGRFVAPIRVGLGLPVLDLHYELGGYSASVTTSLASSG
jgi:hypothetical protein